MFYTRLEVTCSRDFSEILIAELSQTGFDTFMETPTGFEAFAENQNFDKSAVAEVMQRYRQQTELTFAYSTIEKRNWNEEWEKSYEPIDVEGKCLIRADFHRPKKKYPHEIVITPKMSFGTGHHQTTYLMIKNQLEIDHKNKSVMDAGCGTAILSIMASKLGASTVEAFDIDEWSVINGEENISINGCTNIHLHQSRISDLSLEGSFDIVLANINKNVLLDEMEHYYQKLGRNGLLLLSGFYEKDIKDLLHRAVPMGFAEVNRDERESWAALLLRKKH